jgi:hypothetical protein
MPAVPARSIGPHGVHGLDLDAGRIQRDQQHRQTAGPADPGCERTLGLRQPGTAAEEGHVTGNWTGTQPKKKLISSFTALNDRVTRTSNVQNGLVQRIILRRSLDRYEEEFNDAAIGISGLRW